MARRRKQAKVRGLREEEVPSFVGFEYPEASYSYWKNSNKYSAYTLNLFQFYMLFCIDTCHMDLLNCQEPSEACEDLKQRLAEAERQRDEAELRCREEAQIEPMKACSKLSMIKKYNKYLIVFP